LEREDIYRLLDNAKNALYPTVDDKIKNKDPKKEFNTIRPATIDSKVSNEAHLQYFEVAKRFFGYNQQTNLHIPPEDAQLIIDQIKKAKTLSTLRVYAKSVRHISMQALNTLKKEADKAQRAGEWGVVENIVCSKNFAALVKLSEMLPYSYRQNWEPKEKRKSKKKSLSRLPLNWRELMAAKSKGQFRIPMMIALLTGVRPEELKKGVVVKLHKNSLYVHINGAKVTEKAGQKYRHLKLANHSLTKELIQIMQLASKSEMLVQVDKGNSVTTHMRAVGKKIWPRRKESITCYTSRHAMAAQCKQAIYDGANLDLVSQVLGHIVDKTASYYGNRFQSGGASVVPTTVRVPKEIKRKSAARSANRKTSIQLKNNASNKNRP
jgi:hypothetical protein